MSHPDKVHSSHEPRRPVFFSLVPLTARATLFYDLRSAPLTGVYLGVLSLLPWVLKHTFGGSAWEVAVLSAAPPTAHLLDIYWAHLCTDRRKMPWVLWPGLISRGLIVLVGFALNSTMLVTLGVLSYFVSSMATPAFNSILRTNYPGTHRYGAQGVVMAVANGTMSATAFAAGMLLKTWESDSVFRMVFVVGGLAGMLGTWVLARIRVRGELSRMPTEETSADHGVAAMPGNIRRLAAVTWDGVSLLWTDPRFGKYQLIQFISGFANIMTGPVLIELLKRQSASWLEAALVLGVAPNLLKPALMPFFGRFLQRMNPMQARLAFNSFWCIGYLLIAASGLQVAWVIGGQLAMGVAMGATTLLWSLQQMYFASKRDVPRYMGIHCTLTGIRGITAPFCGVALMYLFDGPHLVYVVSAMISAASVYLSWRLARHEKLTTGHTGHVDGGGAGE